MATIEEVAASAKTLSPTERLRLVERLLESTPCELWPVPTDENMVEAKRLLMESDARWMEPVPWPIVQRLVANSLRSSRPKVYSAPRRFDLATIFIVTIAYSLLLGGMSLLQFPPGVSLAIAGFITLVGIGQALLFGGKKPRTASLLVGVAIYATAMLVYWIASGPRMYPVATLLTGGPFVIIGGGILGYLAGACVGAAFLLADVMRIRFRWTGRQEEETAPGES